MFVFETPASSISPVPSIGRKCKVVAVQEMSIFFPGVNVSNTVNVVGVVSI